MIRSKLGLLSLCAVVLGVMAMSASAAQGALSWLVLDQNGTNLESLKALLDGENDSLHLTLLVELNSLKVAISCTSFTPKGFFLEAGGKLTEGGKAVFTGCGAYKEIALGEDYGCTVKSPGAAAGTIETNELKGELALVGSEVLIKIAAKGTDLAIIRLEGCKLTEVNPLRGVLYLKDAQGFVTTHKVEHLIQESPPTALYFGAHTGMKLELTKIHGSVWVRLGSDHTGLSWSGMDA